ncbi:uncharacterized protein YdcI [Sitodiplosis mosellana]|uniref:uncharacterized protein YdcI n=1 Tax=Sitodiplosis mosellana TaxID=263140 RepID=UPI002443E76E|nr:uncharacterized protein YdcI [Sitodiplosis mosellana]
MSAINKRSTRKRATVAYVVSSSESEDEASPKKKQKKMGCSGSKQKNVVNETISRKRNAENVVQNVEMVKGKTAAKPSRQKLARVDAAKSDEQTTGWTDVNTSVQRSVTPPPRVIVPPPSPPAPASKRASKSTRSKWTDEELLCQLQLLDSETSSNIVRMFDEGNTIPFMCRYRREMIGNLSADEMRDIKITYNHIKNIRARAETIVKDLQKRDLLDDEIEEEIFAAKSLDALDHLYAPFRAASKSSLFERAKALGLEDAANKLLHESRCSLNFSEFVKKSTDGLDTVDKVKEGVKNIVSHIFSKDTDVLEAIENILKRHNNGIKIETSENTKVTKAHKEDIPKGDSKKGDKKRGDNPRKFEIYFNFQGYLNNMHSHQTLAINRGENLKFLSVKIVIPDRIQNEIYKLIQNKYFVNANNPEYKSLLSAALNDAYSKKLKPLMNRQIRSLLTKNAEKESVEVFAKNLKQLLLVKPVKGKRILGVDPGFKNGCKLALISEQNDVLDTDTIYPHTKKDQIMIYEHKVINMLRKNRCEVIAIGNGTACRETEAWISQLISRDVFHSESVQYCIVSENGASIYSCSDVAKHEFPNMDVNLISAVSIARRLSDPLAELVKIEPKHLGVGMYQHDINEKYLMESLNEIVSECVSFVGVDINTASVAILKHIAGMNATRAENIVKYRAEKGPFKSRDEVKKVKAIGAKTFEQCAGFIWIDFATANLKGKPNILDSTWVHPESYEVAKKIIAKFQLSLNDIGTEPFIARIKQAQDENATIGELAKQFRIPVPRVEGILEALARELQKDYRDEADIRPLFKQGLLKMSDLKVGTTVTGAVTNITTFGYFVDIGVENNGLIHSKQMRGQVPNIGDRVNAYVMAVDQERGRIQLRLENIL